MTSSRTILLYAANVALTALVAACSHQPSSPSTPPQPSSLGADDLLIREDFNFEGKDRLSASEIHSDLQILQHALRTGYGGRSFVPKEEFASALADLERIPMREMSSQELCEEIEKALVRIPDMHLGARIRDSFCSPLRRAKFLSGTVGPNTAKDSAKPWSLAHLPVDGKLVPIISITRLPAYEDASWNGFFEVVATLKNSAPALIVDLRGNGGGSDAVALAFAANLFGQDAPSPIAEIVKSQTPETMALKVNAELVDVLRYKRKGEEVPGWQAKRLENALARLAEARKGQLPAELRLPGRDGQPYDAKKAFAGPIAVLIDHECASACESAVEALMQHPNAITIGENTGGFVHFGNLGLVVLPNSQIAVRLATDYWSYKDGRYVEAVGYAPSIAVPSGEDALQSARRALSLRMAKGLPWLASLRAAQVEAFQVCGTADIQTGVASLRRDFAFGHPRRGYVFTGLPTMSEYFDVLTRLKLDEAKKDLADRFAKAKLWRVSPEGGVEDLGGPGGVDMAFTATVRDCIDGSATTLGVDCSASEGDAKAACCREKFPGPTLRWGKTGEFRLMYSPDPSVRLKVPNETAHRYCNVQESIRP